MLGEREPNSTLTRVKDQRQRRPPFDHVSGEETLFLAWRVEY